MTQNNRLDSTFLVDVVPQKELLEPNVQVGPYIVQNEIGSGAMGAVYQAVHTKLKRTVALKLLSNSLNTNSKQLARFQREMEAIGCLDHPNIVRATDAGEYQNIHYLVMELVIGLDVQKLLARVGVFDSKVGCEIARQTALGLQHIHENHLVHRDIKPSNLLVTDTGTVKILDLGIAMLRRPEGGCLTVDGALMGTPDFMAPEQIDGSTTVDIRADIYSLGCTLYMLLSGRPPFCGPEYEPHVAKLIAQTCDSPPALDSLVPGLPSELARMVARLMAKDVEDRYQTPREVADALAVWADDEALRKLAASVVIKKDVAANVSQQPAGQGEPPHRIASGDAHRTRRNVIRAGLPIGMGLLLALAVLNRGTYDSQLDNTQTLPVSTQDRMADGAIAESPQKPSSQVELPAKSGDGQIAASLRSVAEDTHHIRQDARLFAESGQELRRDTQRIADTLDELRATFHAATRHGGPIANARSAGEFYHNARVYQQQGNNALAREAYLRLVGLGAEFVDVHHHFQQFLILQEGRAGARLVYRNLPADTDHVVRRYALSILQELPERREQLAELVRRDSEFAPAVYALGLCSSKELLGQQSLTDKVTEKKLLEEFLSLHEQGHLLRHFLDQSEAATMIDDAQQRLALLKSLDPNVLDQPVSLTVSKHRRGWMLTFQLSEAAREIQYRLDPAGEFRPTGFADHPDPNAGFRLPKTYVQLPLNALQGKVEVRYSDVHGTLRGPFVLVFDPVRETLRDTKRRLGITQASWVRFGAGRHANRLYFSHLAAHRDAIAKVRYAVDNEVPKIVYELPDTLSGNADGFHVDVSPEARFAVVQLDFRDGSQSEVVRIER